MSTLLQAVSVSTEACVVGYTGTTCKDCTRPGYYRLGDLCQPCPPAAYGTILLFGIVFGTQAACPGALMNCVCVSLCHHTDEMRVSHGVTNDSPMSYHTKSYESLLVSQ
jgi:hypothetical protein